MIILDEPNSNLDADGENRLKDAVAAVKVRGGIALIITHRQNVLNVCDTIMVMENGKKTVFEPKEKVFGIKRVA